MIDVEIVKEIEEHLINKLQHAFGYCGVMTNKNHIMINSGKENIVIDIKWKDTK